MARAPLGLAVLALAAVALLVANTPVQSLPSELAALRLPEPQHLSLPDPAYQSGFPEVRAPTP